MPELMYVATADFLPFSENSGEISQDGIYATDLKYYDGERSYCLEAHNNSKVTLGTSYMFNRLQVAFRFYGDTPDGYSSDASELVYFDYDVLSPNVFRIFVNKNNQFEFVIWDNSIVATSAANTYIPREWIFISIDLKVDNVNGWCYLYVNENLVLSYNGPTKDPDNFSVEPRVNFGFLYRNGAINATGWNNHVFYDDITIWDSSDLNEPSSQIPYRYDFVRPIEQASYNEWTGSDGDQVDNYKLIQVDFPYKYDNYLTPTEVNQKQSVKVATHTVKGQIHSVIVKADIHTINKVDGFVKTNSGILINGNPVGQFPNRNCWVFPVSPALTAWTQEEINSLEIGIINTEYTIPGHIPELFCLSAIIQTTYSGGNGENPITYPYITAFSGAEWDDGSANAIKEGYAYRCTPVQEEVHGGNWAWKLESTYCENPECVLEDYGEFWIGDHYWDYSEIYEYPRYIQIGFWIKGQSNPDFSGTFPVLVLHESNAPYSTIILKCDNSGTFSVWYDENFLAQASLGFSFDEWTFIGIDLFLDSDNGWFYLYIGDQEVIAYNGPLGGSSVFYQYISEFEWRGSWAWKDGIVYLDDLYIAISHPSYSPKAPRPKTFEYTRPVSSGTFSDFDGSDGDRIDNYQLVDDLQHDSDVTYIETPADYIYSNIGKSDSFVINYTIPEGKEVYAVCPVVLWKTTESNYSQYMRFALYNNSNGEYSYGNITSTGNLTDYYSPGFSIWKYGPNKSNWTQDTINNTEFVIRCETGNSVTYKTRITSLGFYIILDSEYTPPTPRPPEEEILEELCNIASFCKTCTENGRFGMLVFSATETEVARVGITGDYGKTWTLINGPFSIGENIVSVCVVEQDRHTKRWIIAKGSETGNIKIAYSDSCAVGWTSVDVSPDSGGAVDSGALFAINKNNIWLGVNGGRIFFSANGGETWVEQQTPTTEDIHAIHFCDTYCGFAVASSGQVIKTKDGGNTWVRVTDVPGTQNINCIHCFNEHRAVVGTEDGYIYMTFDGGDTWVVKKSVDGKITDISFSDDFVGYASATLNYTPTKGKILRTLNGGQDWENLPTPLCENINALNIITPNKAWFVGRESGSAFLINVS